MERFSNNYVKIYKTDAVPFASSSEEEDEVIVGQTLAEINTPSMLFEDASIISVSRLNGPDGENKESSVEAEEEEELKKIQLMEEKYLQQISAEIKETQIEETENQNEKQQLNIENETEEDYEELSQSDSDDENEVVIELGENQPSDYEDENAAPEEYREEKIQSTCNYETVCSSESQKDVKDIETMESFDQQQLVQIIQSSLTSLKIADSEDNEGRRYSSSSIQETQIPAAETSSFNGAEKIALAVVKALKSVGFDHLSKSQMPVEYHEPDNTTKIYETNGTEVAHKKDDFEEEKEVEVEKSQSSLQNNNDQDICYDAHFDYRITSKTPTSFNSDDYIFHANFIKKFYRADSTDKLRAKPHPRKSMSFSNERMREIERHNQILLRKILTQKPTYNLKSKSSQSSLQKLPSQTNTRVTTSALNRKKQQRQIDLDNQVLRRKIEAIALRRRPFITWND